jgi:hypothetical protein
MLMSLTATRHPSLAKSRASPRPNPLPAPVIATVFVLNRSMKRSFQFIKEYRITLPLRVRKTIR